MQQDPESVPNVIPIELLEALGVVPALKQKGLTHGGLGQPLLELAGLAGEHDGREGLQGLDDRHEFIRVRVVRGRDGWGVFCGGEGERGEEMGFGREGFGDSWGVRLTEPLRVRAISFSFSLSLLEMVTEVDVFVGWGGDKLPVIPKA